MNSKRSKSALTSLGERFPKLLGRDPSEPQGPEKGPKAQDAFEVWHHHSAARHSGGDWALLLELDQRR